MSSAPTISRVTAANCTTNPNVTGFCGTCSPYPKNCTLGFNCANDWSNCNSTAGYCCAQIMDIKNVQMPIAMCLPTQPVGVWSAFFNGSTKA